MASGWSGFDNAHPVARQRRGEPQDHRHRLRTIRPYDYQDAATLLADFWDDGGRGVARERSDPMTTLKVGIASYEDMKARTMAVARGERRIAPDEPKVWFTSTESFAKVLSAGNRDLLRVIAEKAPGSLDELARITGKAKSNLSRTLRTMEGYGLVRLERGRAGPHHAQGHARPGGTRPAAHPVAEGKLSHDRLGASRPDRRQPVKAGAFRATAARLRP